MHEHVVVSQWDGEMCSSNELTGQEEVAMCINKAKWPILEHSRFPYHFPLTRRQGGGWVDASSGVEAVAEV